MKTNEHGHSTFYVGEDVPAPAGLPEGVRLVGPGAAPIQAALQARLAAAGGEQSSAGSSSSTSASRTPPSGSIGTASPREPAPTTGQSSKKGRAGRSTAATTGGSTPATG